MNRAGQRTETPEERLDTWGPKSVAPVGLSRPCSMGNRRTRGRMNRANRIVSGPFSYQHADHTSVWIRCVHSGVNHEQSAKVRLRVSSNCKEISTKGFVKWWAFPII